jgi:uncharacterized membrane protein
MDMPLWLALCVGVGLSAACGFRVFIPPLALGVAGAAGEIELPAVMAWMESPAGLAALGTAAALEAGAYYVPWLDNLLDAVASPLALAAGTLMTAGLLEGADPLLQWSAAIIAGGGAATVVQAGTVASRAGSTMLTGGLGNPGISTAEAGVATGLSALTVLTPVLGIILLAALLATLFTFATRWRHRRQHPAATR